MKRVRPAHDTEDVSTHRVRTHLCVSACLVHLVLAESDNGSQHVAGPTACNAHDWQSACPLKLLNDAHGDQRRGVVGCVCVQGLAGQILEHVKDTR